ncbi:MAG: hypothetical protein LBD38_04750 [Streptococcaceae bacterium]|jgi:DNA-directed RNA polymerase specialized sigma24 family protein|nr:hypothetical protein [Streptococcaceae bacterium]
MKKIYEYGAYFPLVRSVYLNKLEGIMEWEDFDQEAHFLYYQLRKKFDGRIEFGLYFKIALKNMAISLIRKAHSLKRRSNLYADSYESFYVFDPSDPSLEEKYDSLFGQPRPEEHQSDVLAHLDEFFLTLSEKEMDALDFFLAEHEKISESADERKSRTSALSRAKVKFKNYLEDTVY